MSNPELDAFIAQKRSEGQSNEVIAQELIAVGWDKETVTVALAGGNIPRPDAPVATPPVTSQTSGAGQPVQVENVQYNVKVDKVRSKTGLASFVSGISAWIIALAVMYILIAVRMLVLPGVDEDTSTVLDTIVFAIAILVPTLPVGIFATKRLNGALRENPSAIDDIFFKRSIRWNLVLSLFAAACWAMIFVYNALALAVLKDAEITREMVTDSFFFFAPLAGLVYFFWSYQRRTTR